MEKIWAQFVGTHWTNLRPKKEAEVSSRQISQKIPS